jgi:hypoxanthine phosphoribosyltransferase
VLLPIKGRFRCDMPSWRRVVRDSKTLSSLIKNSGFDPNIVVAICRGGLVPARLVCDFLHIKDLTTIKVEHWGIVATPTEKAVIKFPLYVDIKDKRVLLVDDITDTGDTLRVSLEHLKKFEPKEIKTAVLIHKIISAFQPDYYVRKISQWRWVIFPWHIWEDLTVLIKNIKAIGICCEEDIRRELKSKYNIEVQIETIKEILSEIK